MLDLGSSGEVNLHLKGWCIARRISTPKVLPLITTLFRVFAPLYFRFSIKGSVFLLGLLRIRLWSFLCINYFEITTSKWMDKFSLFLFPTIPSFRIVLLTLFLRLRLLNLFSLILYSYPVTTTLGFNLGAALSCWIRGIFIQAMKFKFFSSLLPSNSPWYLVPFLCVVELIRIRVRPVTLCFRLLANMTAGHVLISLICKMPVAWTLGRLFGGLELIVALVQGFVFSILIRVYLEEAFRH